MIGASMSEFEPEAEVEAPAQAAADAPTAGSSPTDGAAEDAVGPREESTDAAASPPPAAGSPVAGSPASGSPVTAALGELDELGDRDLAEHPDVYQRIHGELQRALSAIDDA
jgi:hypothetical protein